MRGYTRGAPKQVRSIKEINKQVADRWSKINIKRKMEQKVMETEKLNSKQLYEKL